MQSKELFGSSQLPQLPRNARYIFHENRCYDWGTFGWALVERKVDTSRYTYIIFMNSSVRGPFLPAFWPVRAPNSLQPLLIMQAFWCLARLHHAPVSWYVSTVGCPGFVLVSADLCCPNNCQTALTPPPSWQAGVHWSDVLTTRINSKVKLVGPTISCEPAWQGGNLSSEKRQVPHVQSYAIATDQACCLTLAILPQQMLLRQGCKSMEHGAACMGQIVASQP